MVNIRSSAPLSTPEGGNTVSARDDQHRPLTSRIDLVTAELYRDNPNASGLDVVAGLVPLLDTDEFEDALMLLLDKGLLSLEDVAGAQRAVLSMSVADLKALGARWGISLLSSEEEARERAYRGPVAPSIEEDQ